MMAVIDWLDIHITEALAQALIHSLWQGVLIVSLLIIGDHTGLVRSAERKYLFYMSGLVLLFLTSVAGFFVTLYWPGEVQSNTILTPFNSLMLHNSNAEVIKSTPFYWQSALVLAWFGGFLYYGIRNMIGSLRLFQLRRRAQKAPMHWQRRVSELSRVMHLKAHTILLSTTDIAVPFVMGVLRPTIIFPANYFVQLTPSQIEVILAHELAHIARNDYLLNIVQIIIESLLFFNPAIWWLSKQIRRQREYCCDDSVQANLNNQKTYLQALYNVARISTTNPAAAVALFDNNSELIMRMKRMSSSNQPQKSLRSLVIASIGLLTVFGLFAFNTIENRYDKSAENILSYDRSIISDYDRDFNFNFDFDFDHGINSDLLIVKLNNIFIENRRSEQLAEDEIRAEIVIPETLNIASAVVRNLPVQAVQTAEYMAKSAIHLLNRSIPVQISIDTNPPSQRMLELEAQMENLAEEMEELAESMEEMIEHTVESDMEEIEAMAERMEELAEDYETKVEDSPEMQRMEELSEELEEMMESIEDEMDDLQEDGIEELQELIEKKSEQYEDYGSLSEEERAKLAADMKALHEELQIAGKDLSQQYADLVNNPEVKRLHEEMQALSKALSSKNEQMQPMNLEIQRLQAEMQVQQQAAQEKMQGAINDLQNAMQLKAQEMQSLGQEFHMEMQRWAAENKKNDK